MHSFFFPHPVSLLWFFARFAVCPQTLPDYVIKMSFIKWDGTQVDLTRAEDPTGFAICVASFGLVGVSVGESYTAAVAVCRHSGTIFLKNCRNDVVEHPMHSTLARTNSSMGDKEEFLPFLLVVLRGGVGVGCSFFLFFY